MRSVLIALLFAFVSHPLAAQAGRPRGAIDGIVSDTSLVPLGGATASILGSELEVRTGENGRFRMLGLFPGQYLVAVRRLGYAPISTFITVTASDTAHASFLLRQAPTELEAMKVRATSVSPGLRDFEERRAFGAGQFMTDEQIQKLNFVYPSGLLRTFRSVVVHGGGVSNTRGAGLRGCPMRIFVDGAPLVPHFGLDMDLPAPNQLAGIEVVTTMASVPMQFATAGGVEGAGPGGAACGVVLMWTKH